MCSTTNSGTVEKHSVENAVGSTAYLYCACNSCSYELGAGACDLQQADIC